MPSSRTPAQQATSRANGARSRGPTTEAGKARSAQNGTRHGLRGGPFALLSGEDRVAALHAAVTSDWGPRDAYEHRWVMELVTCMWRQDRLRALELATLTAAATESPPTKATMKKLLAFARYGARIDKDIGRALQALRVLRNRPYDWIDELQDGTFEPARSQPQEQNCTNDLSPRTSEPGGRTPAAPLPPDPAPLPTAEESRTPEPDLPPLNRHQRRALAAMLRRRAA